VSVDMLPFGRLNNVTVLISLIEILTESGDCGHALLDILRKVSHVIPTQYGDYEHGLF
jgi:hypothetical protein